MKTTTARGRWSGGLSGAAERGRLRFAEPVLGWSRPLSRPSLRLSFDRFALRRFAE